MKPWTTIAVVGLSILAIGLLTSTAFAYALRQQPSQQYRPYSSTSVLGLEQGMMNGGTWGEIMGNGYLPINGYSASDAYPQQYGSGVKGNGRCAGALGWP